MIENLRIIGAVAMMGFGLFSVCVSAVGLFRFKCVLNRIHATAITDTLGVLFSCNQFLLLQTILYNLSDELRSCGQFHSKTDCVHM